jgi:hypothetical protein
MLRRDQGPLVRYERLLLPFACGGSENVERIVGAITLFTEDKAKDTLNSLAIAAT